MHTFTAIAQNGQLEFTDSKRLEQFLIMNPGEVYVSIGKKQKIRSEKQNRYMYGVVLRMMAEHTGYTVEEVKQVLKREFGLTKVVMINNKAVEVLKSSSELSTVEFEDFLSKIRMFGDRLGLRIPEPNSLTF